MRKKFATKIYENNLQVLKTFALSEPYIELWEIFEKTLKLEEGCFPSEENFNDFIKVNNISIPQIDETKYSLIVFPW